MRAFKAIQLPTIKSVPQVEARRQTFIQLVQPPISTDCNLVWLSGALRKPASEPKAEPPVPIKPDYIISLEDGRRYKSMKRHLRGRGLTPEQYREKWGLRPDYPMAPNQGTLRTRKEPGVGTGPEGTGPESWERGFEEEVRVASSAGGAGIVAASSERAFAQPVAPPSTVTTPPRDFSRRGAPTTYFTDPDIISVDLSFDGAEQRNPAPLDRSPLVRSVNTQGAAPG